MTDPAGRVLAALADTTRRAIVRRLASGVSLTPTELANELPITRQAVTKHLRVLEGADLVAAERHGREARYTLRPAALRAATDWIDEVARSWETRLGALKRQVEAGTDDG